MSGLIFSAYLLQPQNLLSLIDETGTDHSKLKIEPTESVLVDNIEDTIQKMTSLKSKGIKFSLDDFGTGYSSMVYLKRLPLEQLKINQSFARDILTDQNDATIANNIITFTQSLELDVLAEGEETAEQRDFLATLNIRDTTSENQSLLPHSNSILLAVR